MDHEGKTLGDEGIYYMCCTYPLAGAALVAVRSVDRPNL